MLSWEKGMRYRLLWIGALAALGSGPALAEVSEYVCKRTSAPISLDGVLDEPAWAAAGVIDGFMTLGPRAEKARNAALVRLLCDEAFLYVGGEFSALPGKAPHTFEKATRDQGVWGSDCIDLFLQPRERDPVTYQLLVSAHGKLHDARNEPGAADPKAWDGQIKLETKQRLGGWRLEMRVPFADLGRQPFRGDVWVFRIGLAANGYELAMWPRNRELSFHNKACRAYLIFEDPNLIANGDFEVLPERPDEPAPGWRFVTNAQPNTPGQGTIRVVTLPDAPEGKHVAELDKTDRAGHWPALLFGYSEIERGATYEFSAFVKAEKPFEAGASFAGPETEDPRRRFYIRGARGRPAAPEFRRIVTRYAGDDRVRTGAVNIRYRAERGRLWVDGVSLRRINGIALSGQAAKQADPIHNLVELSVRTRFKPFWLLKRPDGWYCNDRTVFKDSGTGATIWRMSRHPSYQCRHQYMEISPWNSNGERLMLTSLMQWWRIFMKPDGSAWQPAMWTSASIWDRPDPDVLWLTEGGRALVRHNVATGERQPIKTFQGRLVLWPMSHDGKYLLVKETLTRNGKRESRIHLVPRDVTTGGAGIITLRPPALVHQLWFTKRPDYSVVFSHEEFPYAGTVMTPDGRILKTLKSGMYPGGHHAASPSGKWFVGPDGCCVADWMTGKVVWLSDHNTNHQSWGPDDRWYVGSAGFDLRRIGVEPRFDQLLGSSNSRMKYNVYAAEVHPVVSPDGTKAGYASNMLGYIGFYNLIVRLPEPPLDLKAERRRGAVRLEWRAPCQAKEFSLYRIYQADSMAGPYEAVAAVPASETSHTVPARPEGCFVVTSQEHSGLESNYSSPTTVRQRRGPFLASVEAESGIYESPAEEVFDATAANLYAVLLGGEAPCKRLVLRLPLPAKVKGIVFARVKNTLVEGQSELRAHVNDKQVAAVPVKEKTWHWVKLSGAKPIRLKAEVATVTLAPTDAGIVVDQLVVVDDPGAVPQVFWGKDHRAPGQITEVAGKPLNPYTIRLTWAPPKDNDIAHYNVYAARGSACEPGNETLIVSPVEPEVVDWGLAAETRYAYRVTAVDRAGNESAASDTRVVATPAIKDRVFVRHSCSLRTKGKARLDVPIRLQAPTQALIWVKARCANQNPVARFNILLDGKELREPYQIPWHFVTPHHPGPAKDVWLWSCIEMPFKQSGEGKNRLLPLPAGEHTITLAPDAAFIKRYGDIDVEFGEMVITSDLGYVPPGTSNFLIDPMRGRREP